MASIWEKDISILAGNLDSGCSLNLITAVCQTDTSTFEQLKYLLNFDGKSKVAKDGSREEIKDQLQS